MRPIDWVYLMVVILATTTGLTLLCLGAIYIMYKCIGLWHWILVVAPDWVLDRVFGCNGERLMKYKVGDHLYDGEYVVVVMSIDYDIDCPIPYYVEMPNGVCYHCSEYFLRPLEEEPRAK